MIDEETADITERLRRAAPFMRAVGMAGIVGQHADTCEEAAREISRLRGLLSANGINAESEYICSCGLRREPKRDQPDF